MIVTLTPRTDFFPVPRVEISLDSLTTFDGGDAGATGPDSLLGGSAGSTGGGILSGGSASTIPVDVPSGTDRVTLWARTLGRSRKVRGVVDRFFTGAGGYLDLEAGFTVPTMYELECFDGDVSLGRVSLGSVTLPHFGEPWQVVVQQPLNPALNVVLDATDEYGAAVTRPAPGEVVGVEGVSLPSMIGAGARAGLSTKLNMTAVTRADADRAWATLGTEENPQVPVWLVRGTPLLLPPVLFCDARTVSEASIDVHFGGTRSLFVIDTTEVAPPAPALVISPLSYEDLDVSFASYDARDAAYPSYDDMDTDWSLAGAAGGS